MVKEKPNSTRCYDADGYRRRAACICVRSEAEDEVGILECGDVRSDPSSSNGGNTDLTTVLLVSSSRAADCWVVPGGGVEPEEQPATTAVREVIEEAGVVGQLGRRLGVFENDERKHRTEVFVMFVTDELPEWEDSRSMGRRRKWFSIDEALKQLSLHKPVQIEYLETLGSSREGRAVGEDHLTPAGDNPSQTDVT